MSISTKTGDAGQTSLYSDERVPKTDPRIECLGALDELSAHLGFTQEQYLQNELFELGALVANPTAPGDMGKALKRLESALKKQEATLPPLKNFILAGGCTEAKHLHLARAICRRAERRLCQLSPLPGQAIPYLNRLSDYLFLAARTANIKAKKKEVIWKKS